MSLGPGSIILNASSVSRSNKYQLRFPHESGDKKIIEASQHSIHNLTTFPVSSSDENKKRGKILLESYQPTFVMSPKPSTKKMALKSFLNGITRPNPRSGYLNCRLCNELIWGPNGKESVFLPFMVLGDMNYIFKLTTIVFFS